MSWQTTIQFPNSVNITVYVIAVVLALLGFYYIWRRGLGRVFACIPVITIPLLISSLRTTSVMAMVVDARGFGAQPRRTSLREHPFTVADCIALGTLIALTLTVILLLVFNIGNRQI